MDFESAVFSPDAVVSLATGHNGRLHSMLRSDNSLQLVGVVVVVVEAAGLLGFTYPGQPIG